MAHRPTAIMQLFMVFDRYSRDRLPKLLCLDMCNIYIL